MPYTVLIFYYRQSWLAIKNYIPPNSFHKKPSSFVTVIIAARNEENNIGKCIQSIINQTIPPDKFEVIVVDDYSTDNTAGIVKSFHKENIRIVHLADFTENTILNSYKKKSIETALKFAKGDLIITTDADCIASDKWLETMVSLYKEKQPVFIAAPVAFSYASGGDSFFKKSFKIFQSLDFMALQGITGASVSKKFHNMCNGANLAYEKKIFYDVNGFEGINDIASGDDMLLMDKFQKKYPDRILFLKSGDAIVQTQAAETLKDFFNQRIRWASKAGKYTDKKIILVLLLVYLLNLWIFILAICSFLFTRIFYLLLISLAIKIVAELIFLFPIAVFFKKQKLLWWFPFAQPFHIAYTLLAGWLGKFGSYHWKGRKVN